MKQERGSLKFPYLLAAAFVMTMVASAPTQQPVPPLDLNGVWTVNGVGVGIRQPGANVTATFIGSPGCSITQFFSASLSGASAGSQMSGTITVCRKPVQGCLTPLSATYTAKMNATVQQNIININYEPENVIVRKNRITGKLSSCTTSPAGSMGGSFVLSRCSPGSSDCGCQQANIDILKRIRDGKKIYQQAYENARDNGVGPTFADVNASVDAQANTQGDFGFEQTGAPELKFHGCASDAPASQCTSMEVVPDCKASASGNQSLYDMCMRHEHGHEPDLQRAFQQLKKGEWTLKHFEDYIAGKSTRKEDTTRLVNDEIARYQDDIKFLNDVLSKLEQQRKQNCP